MNAPPGFTLHPEYRDLLRVYALQATYTVLAESPPSSGFGNRTIWAVVAAKTVLSAVMKSSSGGSSDQRAKTPPGWSCAAQRRSPATS